jgi:hypothetical protein
MARGNGYKYRFCDPAPTKRGASPVIRHFIVDKPRWLPPGFRGPACTCWEPNTDTTGCRHNSPLKRLRKKNHHEYEGGISGLIVVGVGLGAITARRIKGRRAYADSGKVTSIDSCDAAPRGASPVIRRFIVGKRRWLPPYMQFPELQPGSAAEKSRNAKRPGLSCVMAREISVQPLRPALFALAFFELTLKQWLVFPLIVR